MSVLLSLLGLILLLFGFVTLTIRVVQFLFFRGGESFKDELYNGFKEDFDEEKIGGQVVKNEVDSTQEIV